MIFLNQNSPILRKLRSMFVSFYFVFFLLFFQNDLHKILNSKSYLDIDYGMGSPGPAIF